MQPTMMNLVSSATDVVMALDDLPEPIWEAFNRFTTVRDLPVPTPDLAGDIYTAKLTGLAKVVDTHTRYRAEAQHFLVVKDEALDLLARPLIGAIRQHGDQLIATNLAPAFATAADVLTEAHAKLPSHYTDAAQLLASGSEVVAIYEQARAAADVLDGIRTIRQRLADLGITLADGDRQLIAATVFATAPDYPSAIRAAEAMRANVRTNPLGCWGALLDVPGVALTLPTLAEQRAHVAALQAGEAEAESQRRRALPSSRFR